MTSPDHALSQKLLPAASLYIGDVIHARLKPFVHRFKYRVYSMLLDLDRLDEADRQSALFSVGRFNLLSFSQRDHGPRDGSGLRAHVDDLLRRAGLPQRCERVMLLCYPRVLGLVFNPLSVYYCLDAQGRIVALIYEVRNTFGDIHSYVAPLPTPAVGDVRQERDKLFHVSPFLDLTMKYKFRLAKPGETLKWRILEEDDTGPILSATFSGRRRDLTTGSTLAVFLSIPLLTLKIVLGIHWEALKLWLKGARFHRRPEPPARASYGERRPIQRPPLEDTTSISSEVLPRPNS